MFEWLSYLLIFVFGYVTCWAFYFLRGAQISLLLLRSAHVVYLSAMIKALENLFYSREIALEHMLKTGKNSTHISSFEIRFEEDTKMLKKRSIDLLISLHPSFFRNTIEFEDWPTAIQYLTENKESALEFWEKND